MSDRNNGSGSGGNTANKGYQPTTRPAQGGEQAGYTPTTNQSPPSVRPSTGSGGKK